MTIETKYNIGDEVWIILNGEPVKLRIGRIDTVNIGLSRRIEYYFFTSDNCLCIRKEKQLYSTKEELLNSL